MESQRPSIRFEHVGITVNRYKLLFIINSMAHWHIICNNEQMESILKCRVRFLYTLWHRLEKVPILHVYIMVILLYLYHI